VIRAARHDELARLIEIERAAGAAFAAIGMPEIARDDPGSVEELEPYRAACRAWVAVDGDDRPVAYLISELVDGTEYIAQVSVHPEHAGRGIGAALIDHLERTAAGRPLTLTTFRDVPWNAPYYARLGFEAIAPADHGLELAELVAREARKIPSTAARVAMRRAPTAGIALADVRALALTLPRTHEGMVRGRVKFYVGRIVYVAFSRDEALMGFAFPREWREAAVESEPDRFVMPTGGDLRYNWLIARMAALDPLTMRDLVLDAWSMVVPQKVVDAYRAREGITATDDPA
jgi:GNAT superfamily N-acetyltransferase